MNSALYDAEYGTQAGGQIDVVTKSGTNDFHGSVFGYLRNSVFDARNFNDFDLNGNPAVPPFRIGQYGLSWRTVDKEKPFFFLSYEGLRQSATTTQASVPSAGIQQGTLAQSPQMCTIMQAFPWRHRSVPSERLSAVCLSRCRFQQSVRRLGPVHSPTPTTIHEDTWLARIDHKFNEKTLYTDGQRDISLVNAPNGSSLPPDKLQTINHPANYLVALQHTFSPRILNETKVYINRSPFINPQAGPWTLQSTLPVGLNQQH